MPDGRGFNRRNFLKASGIAALGAALDRSGQAANAQAAADSAGRGAASAGQGALPAGEAIDLVNVLQGTRSTEVFSRGNTLPIAALPFGMAHWTLQSESNTPWMFQPDNRRLQGLRCTHQLSPWLDDYGEAAFMPICGDPNPVAERRASSWRPEDAKLHPYSFRFTLARYQADVELIPTERCALVTAAFAGSKAPGFLVEIPHSAEPVEKGSDSRTLRFRSTINRGGVPENFANYYVVRFAAPWQQCDVRAEGGSQLAVAKFAQGQQVEARIATSFISFDQAERNLDGELGRKDPDTLRAEAKARWTEDFSRIQIEGGNESQRTIFSSCLYRALLFPRIWHEPDDSGKPHHFSPYNGTLTPGVMYADHGYWDLYRAWYPLMSIVYPERLAEILQAWTNAYKEGGWLPQFPCPGYRACMSGSLIDSVFADAVTKGIREFDVALAYEGLKKHATTPGDPDNGYGRRGLEHYLRLNYLPADRVSQSVAETADAAYGDFCIAEVARVLGREQDAIAFQKRAQNWRNIFDPTTGFLRGKKENGAWVEPFDPFTWGSPYEEGGAWQHRWDVPHDIPGLIAALGGEERTVALLDKMLSLPPNFNAGVYGQEIHEMSEMAAIHFGQYAHNNQPVHHILYIYTAAGRPDRTQYWVRKVMNELYSPDQFSGDEDTGSMAAWFILSSLGIYPLCPGKPEYTLGSPLFDRVTLHLPGAKTMVIEAQKQAPEAVYVAEIFMNGVAHPSSTLPHEKLVAGGQLTFHMQSTPPRKS